MLRLAWLDRYISFFIIALLYCSTSCKDNLEETPALFFANPKNESVLWNTVTLDLNSSAVVGDKIDLFLSDSLIGTITQSPYTFNLNTKSIQDGNYVLKAISAGDQTTAFVKISIRNNLLVLNVDNNHLTSGTRGFLFLSDREGTTLTSVELKNGDQIKISNENYPYENFILSETYVTGTRAMSIYSFQEVPRGEWTLLKKNEYPGIINNIGLDFTDISSAYYYVSSSGDAEFLYSKSSMDLSINKTPTKLFIREFNNSVNRFKIVHDLNPMGRQTISLSDISTPLDIEKIVLSGGTNKRGTVRLFGFPTGNNFQEYYNLGIFFSKNAEIKIEYPGNGFPVYGSTSFYKDDDITINSFQLGKKSDLLPFNVEVSFKRTASLTATVSTFGDIDMFAASWSYFNEKSNTSAYWAMFGPPGRSQIIKLPELPGEIKIAALNVNMSELEFSNTLEVTNFDIAADYPSYLKYVSQHSFAGPYAFGKSWKEQIFSKSGSTRGKTTGQDFTSLSDQFFRK